MRVMAHGIDIVEVARIVRMLRDHGDRFLERCFTETEQAYAASVPEKRGAERLAARFACKEAVFKALGTGWSDGTSWCDVCVTHDQLGKPVLQLSGRSGELAAQQGITQWHVSISHTDSIAAASVIGYG